MTKKEIAHCIAGELNISKTLACEVVQRVFDKVTETVVRKGRLELRNFGIFELRHRAPRKARNPQTQQGMRLPARVTVSFRPGKTMAEKLNALSTEPEACP